jgi:hypothetical protein
MRSKGEHRGGREQRRVRCCREERERAPAQELHRNNAEGAGAHQGVSGSGEEREAGRHMQNNGETSSEGQRVGRARDEQGEQEPADGTKHRNERGSRGRGR